MVWHSLYGALNGTESPPTWDVKKIASRTLAFPNSLWHVPRAFNMCRRSSGVERTLGKGEADSSILSGGTILSPPHKINTLQDHPKSTPPHRVPLARTNGGRPVYPARAKRTQHLNVCSEVQLHIDRIRELRSPTGFNGVFRSLNQKRIPSHLEDCVEHIMLIAVPCLNGICVTRSEVYVYNATAAPSLRGSLAPSKAP